MLTHITRFDRADRAAMATVMSEYAALDRGGPGDPDTAGALFAAALEDRAADYTAWQLIGIAVELVRRLTVDQTTDVFAERVAADVDELWTSATDMVLDVVNRAGAPERVLIDRLIRTFGPVHALDAAALVLRTALGGQRAADAAAAQFHSQLRTLTNILVPDTPEGAKP